ncbi:hypothetical protein PS2015_2780 [Pseudohongiella spirulinae]|uniref:Uncharacterized protein n=1 Tax=Pseudohongiella spirulinae TaxID=1249552 RepID=A0A0S2KHB7_9GAMM|nr:hypothetical protein PS2015_2780 [Pseudohongiella spirulinae]
MRVTYDVYYLLNRAKMRGWRLSGAYLRVQKGKGTTEVSDGGQESNSLLNIHHERAVKAVSVIAMTL